MREFLACVRFSRHNLASFRPLVVFNLGGHRRRGASFLFIAASLRIVAVALAITLVLCGSAVSQPELATLRCRRDTNAPLRSRERLRRRSLRCRSLQRQSDASTRLQWVRGASAPALAAVAALAICKRGMADCQHVSMIRGMHGHTHHGCGRASGCGGVVLGSGRGRDCARAGAPCRPRAVCPLAAHVHARARRAAARLRQPALREL